MSKSKKQMVGDVPGPVLGMLADLMLKLRDGSRTPEQLDSFNKGRNPFRVASDLLTEWQDFYHKVLGMKVDLSGVRIPKKRGFDRVLVVAKGLTVSQVVEVLRKRFTLETFDVDFSREPVKNDRVPDKSYAVACRERVEADEELANRSANQLATEGIATLTLLERLLYELKYHEETDQHLDVVNVTLCVSSRSSDGSVPHVDWLPGGRKLCVFWFSPGCASPYLRGRAAVS